MASQSPIRLGISGCLLGDPVRYDGGHKRDAYLAVNLSQQVQWVPICPEVEAGLGTPREPMQLIKSLNRTKLVTVATRQDKTLAIKQLTTRRLREMESLDLSGYVFKARSPSCGIVDVPRYDLQGKTIDHRAGLFAAAVRRRCSLMPITDEESLSDPLSRDLFLQRVCGYHRLQPLLRGPVTRNAIIAFHHAEAPLLLTLSQRHYLMLTTLISHAKRYRPEDLAKRYTRGFMNALAVHPSPKKSALPPRNTHTHHAAKAGRR